jgi:hypothetical protein
MILVEDWIKESRENRTAHLQLDEACIERGGNSTVHRGVLAQYLNTNLPSKVDLCHACHNDKCSNPKHLYWGTRKENVNDMMVNRKIHGRGDKSIGGKANKGKPKTEEHKKNIAEKLKSLYNKE